MIELIHKIVDVVANRRVLLPTEVMRTEDQVCCQQAAEL